jgi:hypothetical protein
VPSPLADNYWRVKKAIIVAILSSRNTKIKKEIMTYSWAWGYIPVISALRKMRQ